MRKLRISLIFLIGLLLVAAAGIFALYRAVQYVPPAYQTALAMDAQLQVRRSDELLQQASALSNQVRKPGKWEAVFTAEQVNGWLAVDLMKNHAGAVPPGFHEPRVAIEPGDVRMFCRYEKDGVSSVLTLAVEPFLPEPNVLAVRIRAARAGLLPVPLGEVLKGLSKAAAEADLRLEWRQSDGDPVAILPMKEARDDHGNAVRIDKLEVRAGEIYVAGTTSPADEPAQRPK